MEHTDLIGSKERRNKNTSPYPISTTLLPPETDNLNRERRNLFEIRQAIKRVEKTSRNMEK